MAGDPLFPPLAVQYPGFGIVLFTDTPAVPARERIDCGRPSDR